MGHAHDGTIVAFLKRLPGQIFVRLDDQIFNLQSTQTTQSLDFYGEQIFHEVVQDI